MERSGGEMFRGRDYDDVRVAERKGEVGKWVLITELKEIADKEEVLDRGGR